MQHGVSEETQDERTLSDTRRKIHLRNMRRGSILSLQILAASIRSRKQR